LCVYSLVYPDYKVYAPCYITLDNKFPKKFCICDEYFINLSVCIYEVRKGTKKLLGSSFKIMLPLRYITE